MPMMKAPGQDAIASDIIVVSEGGVTELTHLVNMMYREGCFPEQMNK